MCSSPHSCKFRPLPPGSNEMTVPRSTIATLGAIFASTLKDPVRALSGPRAGVGSPGYRGSSNDSLISMPQRKWEGGDGGSSTNRMVGDCLNHGISGFSVTFCVAISPPPPFRTQLKGEV